MLDQEDECKEEEDRMLQSISAEEEEESRKEDSGRSEYKEWIAAEGSGITLGSIFGDGVALAYEHASPRKTHRLHGCPRSHLALATEHVLVHGRKCKN
jgi:hypothetical protein